MSTGHDAMPPLPPRRDALSLTEFLPFRSKKINVWKSGLLPIGFATAVLVVYSFRLIHIIYESDSASAREGARNEFINYVLAYTLFLTVCLVHFYSRSSRSILYYVLPFAITIAGFHFWVWDYVAHFFYKVLPGGTPEGAGLLLRFKGYFIGTGMTEEFYKAIPILLGALVGSNIGNIRRRLPPRLGNLLSVDGPLDGMLIGIAAGAAFTFDETGGQYVPNLFKSAFEETHNELAALGAALMLLVPRAIDGLLGHMAYAGIVGYFVGLSVLRRSSAPALIAGGFAYAVLLHAIWDTFGGVPPVLYAVGILTVLSFAACLLKARQLEMVRQGGEAATQGSIVLRALSRPFRTVPAPDPAAAAAPRGRVEPVPAGLMPQRMVLILNGERTALPGGAILDLGQLTRQRISGGCEVSTHPRDPDMLGLRNTGAESWTARLLDGRSEAVLPRKAIRMSPGVRIDFGGGVIGLIGAG